MKQATVKTPNNTYRITANNTAGLFIPGKYVPYVTDQHNQVVALPCSRDTFDSRESAIYAAQTDLRYR